MILLNPTNLQRLALRGKCLRAYCSKGSVLLEIGTWVISIGVSESDSMVSKGSSLEIGIVLSW